MAKKLRKTRTNIATQDVDLLIPFDVLSFGSSDDPCFGMHYDMTAPECISCGDSEFCAIAKAQNLHVDRKKEEGKQRFKDIEESELEMERKRKAAIKLIEQHKTNGTKRLKAILLISEELNLPKEVIKSLYK